jgi:hypothetical protein
MEEREKEADAKEKGGTWKERKGGRAKRRLEERKDGKEVEGRTRRLEEMENGRTKKWNKEGKRKGRK